MPNDPSGFWTRTVALGFDEPLTARLLEQVIEFDRDQGSQSARLVIAPQVLPPDWDELRAGLNISATGSAMIKLAGRLDAVTGQSGSAVRLDEGLRVGPVPAARVEEYAELMLAESGLPVGDQLEMSIAAARQPGWQIFAVYDRSAMVATANLRVDGVIGHMFGGVTLSRARHRGAQSALIAAPAVAAREAGCTVLMGETAAEKPGEHNSSLRNMLRAGLTVQYERRNWIWESPTDAVRPR